MEAKIYRRLLNAELNTPNGTETRSNYVSATNFDTNMVIILAALLCALIAALGLNSIVRCVLRCSRGLVLETAEQTAVRQAATGMKKRELRQIPVAVYDTSSSRFPGTECTICLGEFADGQQVRVLPQCNHGFHVPCIDTWLLSHSSCPNCRHSLLQLKATGLSGWGENRENAVGNGGITRVN